MKGDDLRLSVCWAIIKYYKYIILLIFLGEWVCVLVFISLKKCFLVRVLVFVCIDLNLSESSTVKP